MRSGDDLVSITARDIVLKTHTALPLPSQPQCSVSKVYIQGKSELQVYFSEKIGLTAQFQAIRGRSSSTILLTLSEADGGRHAAGVKRPAKLK